MADTAPPKPGTTKGPTAGARGAGGATAPRGVGGRLTAKVGPLPVYAWALIIVGVGYLAYRHYAGGSSATGASSFGPQGAAGSGTMGTEGDTSGAAGGASAGSGESYGDNGFGTIAALLGQQGAALADLSAQVGAGTPYQGSATGDFALGATPDTLRAAAPGTYLDTTVNAAGVTQFTPIASGAQPYATPASAPNFAATATQKTQAAAAAGKAAPFGGVVSVKKLANGSSLTTYASGRQVQQVPGKSAYVVKA